MLTQTNVKHVVYPESEILGFTRYDPTVHFSMLCERSAGARILDVGCGHRSPHLQTVLYAREVVGIDVDESCADNPDVDTFRAIFGPHWRAGAESFDMLTSRYVLEHVEDPDHWFKQANMALRPGGVLLAMTPNKRFYVCLAARVLPNRCHHWFVPRAREDVYPTLYRANTRRRLLQLLRKHGFVGEVYRMECEPNYFRNYPRLYWLMSYVHRLIPPWFQSTLIIVARKA